MEQVLITKWVDDLKVELSRSSLMKMPCFKQVIIAGSYADWLKNPNGVSSPSWKAIPDVNIYVLVTANPAEEIDAMTALGNVYRTMMEKHTEISLLLDLHPFAMSVGKVVPGNTLQITSRIINALGSYPDYCWFGWKSNYITLLGEDFISQMDVRHPVRDIVWLEHMHMAFASYSNVMSMIALSSMVTNPLTRFDESYRYLKEVIKDGISLGLSLDEYPDFDYSVIKQWKDKTDHFYETYYGAEEAAIVRHVLEVEKDYFAHRTAENAEIMQKEFAILHAAVYEKGFKARCIEIYGGFAPIFMIPKWY